MGIIHIAGLGPGAVASIPFGTVELLEKRLPTYLRTAQHPSVGFLVGRNIEFQSLDSFYESSESFSEIYEGITSLLLSEAILHGEIVYLVPGHPAVAERSVQLLMQAAKEGKVEVKYGPGQSFLDDLLLHIGVDPVEGLLMLDATSLSTGMLQPRAHTLIVQMYNKSVASEVKMALSEVYGDEWNVIITRAIGVPGVEATYRVKLYELDRVSEIDHLTTLYVPPLLAETDLYGEWSELVRIVAALRGPEGCPWDLEQTHDTLRPYVIEEAYEVAQAIDEGNVDELVEELGDVLLQVLLHSQIGRDQGYFQVRDVIRGISTKLIRRHPHVFGEDSAFTAEEVKQNWEKIKQTEKKSAQSSILDGVKRGQSPLRESMELQKKAAKTGFDWESVIPVYEKIQEELLELQEASTESEKMQEFGDVLFSIVNLGRHLGFDPEHALALTNQKFRTRFSFVENKLKSLNMDIFDVELAILEEFWQNAKEKANS